MQEIIQCFWMDWVFRMSNTCIKLPDIGMIFGSQQNEARKLQRQIAWPPQWHTSHNDLLWADNISDNTSTSWSSTNTLYERFFHQYSGLEATLENTDRELISILTSDLIQEEIEWTDNYNTINDMDWQLGLCRGGTIIVDD